MYWDALQAALREAMGACYAPKVPDVMLNEWTYIRPREKKEEGPESLAALMYSLGTGGDIRPICRDCRIVALQDWHDVQEFP